MLPSPNRLPAFEVNPVLRNGKRISTDLLQLSYSRILDSGIPQEISGQAPAGMTNARFAVVVGVKVSKKAVERNRLKRLIRESIHHILPGISSVDGVFVARKGLVGKTQLEVELLVKDLLEKAGALSFE